jgi:glycogen(starch) synthase
MRVLYWTELFWPYVGGVEILSTKALPAMLDRGYEVIVLTSHGSLDLPDDAEYKGIPIHRLPLFEALATRDLGQLMEALQRVAALKRKFKPDLVHVHYSDPTVFFHLRTARAHPAALVFTIHQALPKQDVGQDTLLGQALRSADWVTTCSAALLADVRQLVPESTPCSSVIHNGLDVPALLPAPLPRWPPRLLCLGRLVPQKGFDVALTAFASLMGRFPHARLIISGDGPSRPELEQQAAELGCRESIDFVGWVAPGRVLELMNTVTMVVMPSRWEGLPLVALQAALMARPIVATRVGGLPEVVVHQETGLLVEKEDSKALAEAIVFLLDHPERAAKMGKAGRMRTQQLYSLKSYVDAYDELYRKLIHPWDRAHPARSVASL